MQNFSFNFIKFFKFAVLFFSIFVFSQLFTNITLAATGINREINFQGKLVNNPLATNVADTSYTVVFTLYDNASGGTALWTETQTVTTTDGIFRVALGSVTPFPANFNFNWSGLYLGMKVNSDAEMSPRIQMAAVPFAFNSQQVAGLTVQDTSGNASTSGTLQIGNGTTINLGTNNLTFTTTGPTALTLPTTGTLLTNTESVNQTVTSTQTTGNLLSLADSTGLTGGITGLTVGLTSSTNSQNKTGISFDLSGGTSGTYFDLLGTGSTWSITRAGALTVTSCSGCGTGGSSYSPFEELAGGVITPNNSTEDLLIGGQSSGSASFHVFGGAQAGTQPVASISAKTSYAALVVNNNGVGDLLTASSSGSTKFVIQNSGLVGIGTSAPDAQLQVVDKDGNGSSTASVLAISHQSTGQAGFTPDTGGTLSTGLAAYWKMDETSGSTVSDSFGSHNGTANGTTVIVGKINDGRNIGTSDSISSTYQESGISAFSIALWIKTTSNNGQIFTDRGGAKGITLGFGGIDAQGSNGAPYIGDDGPGVFIGKHTSTLINDNAWHFLVGTWSGGGSVTASQFHIYVDGNDVTGSSHTTGSDSAPITGDASGGTIGSGLSSAISVDEMGLWTKALSQQEVTDLYNSSSGNSYSPGSVSNGIGAGLVFEDQNSAAANVSAARISGLLTSISGGAENGALTFETKNNGVLSEKARIDTYGDLGLNTISPLGTLDVRSNVFSGGTIPIASLSGKTSFAGLVVDNTGLGDLFTASKSGLSIFTVKNNGQLVLGAPYYNTCTLKTDSTGLITCGTDNTGGGGANWFNELAGALSPVNTTDDFLLGSTSTSSAIFSFTGIKSSTHQTIASFSGQLDVFANNGYGGNASFSAGLVLGAENTPVIQTTANKGLTIGGNTTGNITIAPNNGTGILIVGSSTNGLSFDVQNGGTTYTGTARPSKTIVLSPEYAGASLTADGSSNTNGSMTSDNTLNAGSVGWKNYYQWSSTVGSLQDYTVAVRVTLPSDFDSWQTGSCGGSSCALEIAYQTGVSGTTDNAVSIQVNNAESTPGTVICTISAVSSTTWTTTGCTSSTLATSPTWNTAGSTAIIRIKVAADNTASALSRIGDITLRYYAKF